MKSKSKAIPKQGGKLVASKAKRKSVTRGLHSRVGRSPITRTDTAPPPNDKRRTSKKATIEALVRGEKGAAIADLMTATGWQQHSIRAALTGLRKAGHTIKREREASGGTRYRIAESA